MEYILVIALILAAIAGGIAFIVFVSEAIDIANGDE